MNGVYNCLNIERMMLIANLISTIAVVTNNVWINIMDIKVQIKNGLVIVLTSNKLLIKRQQRHNAKIVNMVVNLALKNFITSFRHKL